MKIAISFCTVEDRTTHEVVCDGMEISNGVVLLTNAHVTYASSWATNATNYSFTAVKQIYSLTAIATIKVIEE